MLKWLEEKDDTPEQRAQREIEEAESHAKWLIEAERRRIEAEEAVRFAVPRTIEALRKDAQGKLDEALRLEALLAEFPDLHKHTGRWEKVAYYSKTVNERVSSLDVRHNCGCCSESPLEVWPYVETPQGRVYSDPPSFWVGHRDPYNGGDRPDPGWDEKLRAAGIPEGIITRVQTMLTPKEEEDES